MEEAVNTVLIYAPTARAAQGNGIQKQKVKGGAGKGGNPLQATPLVTSLGEAPTSPPKSKSALSLHKPINPPVDPWVNA